MEMTDSLGTRLWGQYVCTCSKTQIGQQAYQLNVTANNRYFT